MTVDDAIEPELERPACDT